MKFWVILAQALLILGLSALVSPSLEDASLLQDNEFAEFEQFDSDDDSQEIGVGSNTQPQFNNIDDLDEDILVEVRNKYTFAPIDTIVIN